VKERIRIMKISARKMFKNTTIGAGLGAVGGGIYGGMKAYQEIQNLPVDRVELGGYERPIYVEKPIPFSHNDEYGQFVLRNPDGTIQMEYVSPKVVEGHGTAVSTQKTHNIYEPDQARVFHDGMYLDEVVDYKPVGTWTEPVVKFEHGVNVAGSILEYAAAGALLGGIGGALVTLAMSSDKEEQGETTK